RKQNTQAGESNPDSSRAELGTLLDYLPSDTIFLLLEPEQLTERADDYAELVPSDDPFFISWDKLQERAANRRMTLLSLSAIEVQVDHSQDDLVLAVTHEAPETDSPSVDSAEATAPALTLDASQSSLPGAPSEVLGFDSLDAFRPLAERPPEPQVAESQRRE